MYTWAAIDLVADHHCCLSNCVWAAYRLLLVVVSYIGLFCFSKPFTSTHEPFSAYYHPSREHLNLVEDLDDQLDEKAHEQYRRAALPGWRIRRDRRLRAAIFFCLRAATPSSNQSSPAFLPYVKPERRQRRVEEDLEIQEAEKKAERKARREQKRLASLSLRGIDWTRLDDERETLEKRTPGTTSTATDGGFWRATSPYVLPSPTVPSPLMTFSPATNSETSVPSPQTGLHRRIRSLPADTEPDAEERVQVRFDVASATPSTIFTSHRSPPPRPLSISGLHDAPLRPALQSHFSFISDGDTGSKNANSGTSTPAVVVRPLYSPALSSVVDPITRKTPPISSSAVFEPLVPIPPRTPDLNHAAGFEPQPPSTDPALEEDVTASATADIISSSSSSTADLRSARHQLLQRQLTQGAIERRRLSERLLVEVQKLGEAEEAVRREERRLATLRRISEVTERDGTSSTAPSNRASVSAVGGGRLSARTFATQRESTNTSASAWSQNTGVPRSPTSSMPPGLLLPPFRLSYGSSDSSLGGLAFAYDPDSSPRSDDMSQFGFEEDGQDLRQTHLEEDDEDFDPSATAAFLSSDDEDRSATPTQATNGTDSTSRTATADGRRRREFAVHIHPGLHVSPGGTFGERSSRRERTPTEESEWQMGGIPEDQEMEARARELRVTGPEVDELGRIL